MIGAGLSTHQAPHISVPFRFFLTAPLFALAAVILFSLKGEDLLLVMRSHGSIGVMHLFNTGFVMMIMYGALFQMLPVLGGVRVIFARPVATVVYFLQIIGASLFSWGFIHTRLWAIASGGIFLITASLVFATVILITIFSAPTTNRTIRAMTFAVISLVIASVAGLLLSLSHSAAIMLPLHSVLAEIHMQFMLLGWVHLLIAGVLFEIMPMFFVTPGFPVMVKNYYVPVLFSLLILRAVLLFLRNHSAIIDIVIVAMDYLLWALVISFFGLSQYLLQKRSRKLYDPTVWFFRISFVLGMIGATLYISSYYTPRNISEKIASWAILLYLLGFVTSIILGMLNKIIPFLVWFHLMGSGMMSPPNMREVFPRGGSTLMLGGYILFFAALVVAITTAHGIWIILAGIFMSPAYLLLMSNAYRGTWLFIQLKRKHLAGAKV